MRNAPPTLPGMPSRNSMPLKPFRFASTATAFNFAPAPQRNRSPSISMRLKLACARQITTPRKPPSRTSRFEPRPITKNGRFALVAKHQNARQIFFRRQFDIHVRRTANAQRRVLGQRFIAANHRLARNAFGEFVGNVCFCFHWSFQNGAHAAENFCRSTASERGQLCPRVCWSSGFSLSSAGKLKLELQHAFRMMSAICSAAFGACHRASAV